MTLVLFFPQGTPVLITVILFLLQKVCDHVLSFSIRASQHARTTAWTVP